MTKARVNGTTSNAKGDLVVGTGSTTAAALSVGTDGYMLYADSTQTQGIKWAAAPTDATKIPLSTVTAAGDLIVATGSGAVTNLAAGTSGYALTSNGAGAAPTYQAIPTGGMTLISKQTATSGTTLSFASIPQTYTHLKLVGWAFNSNASSLYVTLNSITGYQYAYTFMTTTPTVQYTSGTGVNAFYIPMPSTAGYTGGFEATIPNYKNTAYPKDIYGTYTSVEGGQLSAAGGTFSGVVTGTTGANIAAVSSITCTSSGTISGSYVISLYGMS